MSALVLSPPLLATSASMLGGCRGTTEAHIAAMRDSLAESRL